jgi:hypothetical protein
MSSPRIFPAATDSSHPASGRVVQVVSSEIVALRPFSKAVFELGPEITPETREES